MTPYFFGYGSLVNRATHSYGDCHPARLRGWRRAWVRTEGREVVFLTVVPDAEVEVEGLIAAVPGADWAALDDREAGYARLASGGAVVHPLSPAPDISHYAVPPEDMRKEGAHVILMSYLDVVVQGFLQVFGEGGVARFFETTSGWDTPVLNDRTAPIYPRHQVLSAEERDLVGRHLSDVGARITVPD